ncbi:MAG: C-terminal helicase domain-containing protein, partial [Candidatus Poribacteria bacterium]
RPDLFHQSLIKELRADAEALVSILRTLGEWDVAQDAKLNALHQLLTKTHPNDKMLIFSQFADTVRYLTEQLQARGVAKVAGVTGDSPDPTGLAWRFSPVSNEKRDKISPDDELRVLISTDVLSEGQNLQDCFIVVNYDLPWAIIRLIQRTGRVDRIGQMATDILCYTFWPADGLERLIRLRGRLRQRLRENAEVVGMDEAFFEDDADDQPLIDLYHEKAGVLDDEPETEIDLVSYAYQIWKNATDANPKLKTIIPQLPPVVYSTKAIKETEFFRKTQFLSSGVLVYLNTAEGNSALAWIDQNGNSVTESQFAILRAAECALDTPALPRQEKHHDLVRQGVEHIMTESKFIGGQLGRPSGARFKTYERLSHYAQQLRGTLFETLPNSQALFKAIEQLYRFPLREGAVEKINRQLRSDVRDEQLAELVVNLYEEDKLCLVQEAQETQEPRIICSLGLKKLLLNNQVCLTIRRQLTKEK